MRVKGLTLWDLARVPGIEALGMLEVAEFAIPMAEWAFPFWY